MKNTNSLKKLTLSAMFLALALTLPFLTGQIQQIGSMLSPMHLPVLLCGFICGSPWGFLVGLIAPVLRSLLFTMPPMFPKAVCMAFELATYGLVSGLLHKVMPKKIWGIYASLITAMISGRVIWGIATFICVGFSGGAFGFSAFMASALYNAVPGIIVQLTLIPIIVMTAERFGKKM